MDTLDSGTRRLCSALLRLGAGTDVTERRANPLQPALGARMTFVARPHTPSNYYYYYYYYYQHYYYHHYYYYCCYYYYYCCIIITNIIVIVISIIITIIILLDYYNTAVILWLHCNISITL